MAEVIPAILEKDFPEIERKILLVEKYVKWVQIDFADDTLVPNNTPWNPSDFSKIKSVNLEGHLMVKDPVKYVDSFVAAGFKRLFAHIEAGQNEEFIEKCYLKGVEVGLAIDGPTAFEKIEQYLDNIDVVLVMAINAGFSGQPFRSDTVEKIKKIKEAFFDLPVAVDGAMDYTNAQKVVAVGATRINSNSYLFKSKSIPEAIAGLASLIPQI
jgi:ribulose-phosphate 3-epimerase